MATKFIVAMALGLFLGATAQVLAEEPSREPEARTAAPAWLLDGFASALADILGLPEQAPGRNKAQLALLKAFNAWGPQVEPSVHVSRFLEQVLALVKTGSVETKAEAVLVLGAVAPKAKIRRPKSFGYSSCC